MTRQRLLAQDDVLSGLLAPGIHTVSQLTAMLRTCLEASVGVVWVEGEISDLRIPSSGHMYLTLKDDVSRIRAVVFRSARLQMPFEPHDGLQIICRCRPTVYEPRGDCQVIIEYLEPKGIGAKQLALEQLKERLAKEGLFDEHRKRPLPAFPETVGVITSLSGAVVRDILKVLHRRFPVVEVLIYPVTVQGESAPTDIADAIHAMNGLGTIDVIIVARGGGSADDLWVFNDETLARAISRSAVPVISAIGHEVDYTVADLVADYRAPTPSAAAEAAVPDQTELMHRMSVTHRRLGHAMRGALKHWRDEAHRLDVSRWDPRKVFRRSLKRVDEIESRIGGYLTRALMRFTDRVHALCRALRRCGPIGEIGKSRQRVLHLMHRHHRQMVSIVNTRRERVEALGARLNSLSPLAVLDRGYAIARHWPSRRIIREAGQVGIKEWVSVQLAKGHLMCEVKEVRQ